METMIMRIEDVVDFPERGIVLLVSFVELDTYYVTKIRRLIGTTITVSSGEEMDYELVVKDVSVSFSIAGIPLIGINIQEKVGVDEIRKGAILQIDLGDAEGNPLQ